MSILYFSEVKSIVKQKLYSHYNEEECTHIAKSIFSALSLQSYREIFTHDKTHFISDHETFHRYLNELENNIPLQYVLKEAYFDNLRFEVSPDALIPRPETNQLVDFASMYIQHHPRKELTCVDLCTGSGCIAISLKKRHPLIDMTGVDISESALRIAQKNGVHINVPVTWIHSSLEHFLPQKRSIDLIISNPPYIDEEEYKSLSPQVKKEPKIALTAPHHPLYFYELIAEFGKKHLSSAGMLCVEINENKGRETIKVFENRGYANVRLEKDFYDKDRFVIVQH